MTRRSYSSRAKERIAYATERLCRASALQDFALAAGVPSEVAPEAMERLRTDARRAAEGKTILSFDAFGGRGEWLNQQERSDAA